MRCGRLALGGFIGVGVLLALVGCVDWFHRSGGYDDRPLTVLTADFFNQRTPSRLVHKVWKGDWIFRRDRLEMIDQDLRTTKPDLLLLQETLERIGSSAESDRKILLAGALTDYDWRQQEVLEFADTQETEALAMAVAAPLRFASGSDGRGETWAMGTGGYLMAATIEHEDQPLIVFNVQMPPPSNGGNMWYSFVQERIVAKLRKEHSCSKRLIIGGYLPGDENARRYTDFMAALQLKDSSLGYCQVAGRCFTATPVNDLFMATVGEEAPARVDKIFVHASANIYSSSRDFEDYDATNHYVREFGLNRLWPSQRFAWKTQIRLARCASDDVDALLRSP